VRFVKIDAGI